MVGRGSKLHLVYSIFRFRVLQLRKYGLEQTAISIHCCRCANRPAGIYMRTLLGRNDTLRTGRRRTCQMGDGTSDPSHLSPSTEITIDSELFDSALREPLTEFFARAFRRDIAHRFDNAEEMLRAWQDCFSSIEADAPLSDHADTATLEQLLAHATFDTTIAELGLGTRVE